MPKPDYDAMYQRRHQRQMSTAQPEDRPLSGRPQARPFSRKERVIRGELAPIPTPPKSPLHERHRLQREYVGPKEDRETVKRLSQSRGPIRPLSRPRSR